jgi:hypothetical protein
MSNSELSLQRNQKPFKKPTVVSSSTPQEQSFHSTHIQPSNQNFIQLDPHPRHTLAPVPSINGLTPTNTLVIQIESETGQIIPERPLGPNNITKLNQIKTYHPKPKSPYSTLLAQGSISLQEMRDLVKELLSTSQNEQLSHFLNLPPYFHPIKDFVSSKLSTRIEDCVKKLDSIQNLGVKKANSGGLFQRYVEKNGHSLRICRSYLLGRCDAETHICCYYHDKACFDFFVAYALDQLEFDLLFNSMIIVSTYNNISDQGVRDQFYSDIVKYSNLAQISVDFNVLDQNSSQPQPQSLLQAKPLTVSVCEDLTLLAEVATKNYDLIEFRPLPPQFYPSWDSISGKLVDAIKSAVDLYLDSTPLSQETLQSLFSDFNQRIRTIRTVVCENYLLGRCNGCVYIHDEQSYNLFINFAKVALKRLTLRNVLTSVSIINNLYNITKKARDYFNDSAKLFERFGVPSTFDILKLSNQEVAAFLWKKQPAISRPRPFLPGIIQNLDEQNQQLITSTASSPQSPQLQPQHGNHVFQQNFDFGDGEFSSQKSPLFPPDQFGIDLAHHCDIDYYSLQQQSQQSPSSQPQIQPQLLHQEQTAQQQPQQVDGRLIQQSVERVEQNNQVQIGNAIQFQQSPQSTAQIISKAPRNDINQEIGKGGHNGIKVGGKRYLWHQIGKHLSHQNNPSLAIKTAPKATIQSIGVKYVLIPPIDSTNNKGESKVAQSSQKIATDAQFSPTTSPNSNSNPNLIQLTICTQIEGEIGARNEDFDLWSHTTIGELKNLLLDRYFIPPPVSLVELFDARPSGKVFFHNAMKVCDIFQTQVKVDSNLCAVIHLSPTPFYNANGWP